MRTLASYLALLAFALVGCDSGSDTVSVTYNVSAFGDFPAAQAETVTYEDETGRETESDVALPFSRTVTLESGTQAYLAATSESTTGALGLQIEILVDGEEVESDSGDGTDNPIGTQSLQLSISTTVD